jgi:VanZ family protein
LAYASLQPFTGWRLPPPDILGYLTAPPPRYLTAADALLNVAVYIPLGVFAFVASKRRFGTAGGLAFAAAYGLLTSLALESVQMYIPARIASNLDIAFNAAGALAGAVAGWALSPPRPLGQALVTLRGRHIAAGALPDVALALLAWWFIAQIHPDAVVFGTGDLRAHWPLPFVPVHTPELFVTMEAAVVALNLLAVGLLVSLWLAPGLSPLRAVLGLALLALLARGFAGLVIRASSDPLAAITPGVVFGLLIGIAALAALAALDRQSRAVAAAAAVLLAALAVNLAPANPYAALPRIPGPGASHVSSLEELLRFLDETWPVAAFAYCAWAAARLRQSP